MKNTKLYIICSFFFMLSCNNEKIETTKNLQKNDSYQILKIIKEKSVYNNTYKIVAKIEELEASNDSLAYIEAFHNYCMSIVVDKKMKDYGGEIYSEVNSFLLLKNNIDITTELKLQDKEKLNNQIIRRIFYSSPELLKKSNRELSIVNIDKYRILFQKENIKQFKKLYTQLIDFKETTQFHKIGFSTIGRYNVWLKETQDLSNISGLLFIEYGFVTGDLTMLGIAYLQTNGLETEYTKELTNKIRKALN